MAPYLGNENDLSNSDAPKLQQIHCTGSPYEVFLIIILLTYKC
jgi:hypothetical protein